MPEEHRTIRRKTRHRGRVSQIGIILGKFFRMFVYQSDWKVFPMSALIAGLLAYVIRGDFMKSMEGTLKGAFAITCVALWNGCFNSIQVICREREIIKREHRSGMHISSYIAAHMIYQAVLCLGQTIIMLQVFNVINIRFPAEGFITKWFWLDLSITVFLVTYASDMMALLISALVRTTTGAMTVMPFILIFQLVFSGGFFSLPSWTRPITWYTLSHHGMVCISAQAGYNDLPMASAWNTLKKMRNTSIEGTVTLEDVLKLMNAETAERSEAIREFREIDLQEKAGRELTVGELIDWIAAEPELEAVRKEEYEGSVSIGEIIDIFGEDEVKKAVSEQSAKAGQVPEYERSSENILGCWFTLGWYALLYAFAAMISLEFIDKDKR